jgi:hypothetical protein
VVEILAGFENRINHLRVTMDLPDDHKHRPLSGESAIINDIMKSRFGFTGSGDIG